MSPRLRVRVATCRGISARLCLVFALFMVSPSTTHAAGTPAGTVITNQATVTFKYGEDPALTTVVSNIVSITVAQVSAVNLAPANGSQYARLNTVVDYPFVLVNAGNGTDRFSLTWLSSLGLTAQVYVDANGDQILNEAEIAAGPLTQTPDILEDRSMGLILRLSVPDSAMLTGHTDLFSLTATSLFDPSKHAMLSRNTTILGAVLTVQKSVNSTMPRAGQRVMYTITYTNTGNAMASGIRLTDVLDSRLRYVTGSASPLPDTVSGQMLRWSNMGDQGGGIGTIMFSVDILNNVPASTEIHNVVDGQYADGQNVRSVTSTERNFMTVQSSGVVTVAFGKDTTSAGEPGDTLEYALVIVNNGMLPEAFDLSYTSTRGLTWTFFEDPTGIGHVDGSGPPITNTGSLAGGARAFVVARTVLPLVATDQTVDFTTFRAQSSTNPENFRTVNGSTTISIPRVTLGKEAIAPDPISGKEITYRITYANAGHGIAYDFAVTDSIPANTMYIPESTTLNGVPRTDEADQDNVTASQGIIVVHVGDILPSGTGVIEFRVRIL
jgi:uncharacterized repeat protein (TIGR01451 family)